MAGTESAGNDSPDLGRFFAPYAGQKNSGFKEIEDLRDAGASGVNLIGSLMNATP